MLETTNISTLGSVYKIKYGDSKISSKDFFEHIAPLYIKGLNSLDSVLYTFNFDDGVKKMFSVTGSREYKWFHVLDEADVSYVIRASTEIGAVMTLLEMQVHNSKYYRQAIKAMRGVNKQQMTE